MYDLLTKVLNRLVSLEPETVKLVRTETLSILDSTAVSLSDFLEAGTEVTRPAATDIDKESFEELYTQFLKSFISNKSFSGVKTRLPQVTRKIASLKFRVEKILHADLLKLFRVNKAITEFQYRDFGFIDEYDTYMHIFNNSLLAVREELASGDKQAAIARYSKIRSDIITDVNRLNNGINELRIMHNRTFEMLG